MDMDALSRRRFLSLASAGGLLYAFGRTPGLAVAQAASLAGFSDYKALVCVYLLGGNDSWSMVVPTSAAEYNAYAASRQNLAIARDVLLPITPTDPLPVTFGLHPSLDPLRSPFAAGQLAFISNVGPLIAPTTRADYRNGTVPVPPQLFSHNDQQEQWHTLRGGSQTNTGWAGRLADLLASQLSGQQLPLNVSLSGNVAMQASRVARPYVMGPTGPAKFTAFGSSGDKLKRRTSFQQLIAADYDTVYAREFAEEQRIALASADTVNSAIAAAPPLQTAFPTGGLLGQQLRTVAQLISVRERLRAGRQIFFISVGGFDTHDDQLDVQPGLFGSLASSLAAFSAAMTELGVADNVTTFTASDFGRTLTSNGDGSDHAWGGLQLVLGGSVRGRALYGNYPELRIGAPNDIGGGRFIPDTSSDQYIATLVRWFGLDEPGISQIAPSLRNFSQQDLGLML
jgi:uncharacterized protein (DUF1501 family)